MGTRRQQFIFIAVVVVIVVASLVSLDRASNHPSLYAAADLEGAPRFRPTRAPTAVHAVPRAASPTNSSTPPAKPLDIVAAPPTQPAPAIAAHELEPGANLYSSALKRDAFDKVSDEADRLFSTDGENQNWSVNQQDMDQLDYSLPNGEGDITVWFAQDENGMGVPRAQEAQLPNGETLDRWFNSSGGVEQVSHQYGPGNSVSVYYYENGQPEAIRVMKNCVEIFTRYDQDGRQIQRTLTPAE